MSFVRINEAENFFRRCRAILQSRASFHSHIGDSQKHDVLGTNEFCDMGYWNFF